MLLGEEKTEVAFWSDPQREIAPRQGTVAVVGLGYVGLPVAMAFGRHRPTVGYDVSHRKADNLNHHIDTTGEVGAEEFAQVRHLRLSSDPAQLGEADFIIVAVREGVQVWRL